LRSGIVDPDVHGVASLGRRLRLDRAGVFGSSGRPSGLRGERARSQDVLVGGDVGDRRGHGLTGVGLLGIGAPTRVVARGADCGDDRHHEQRHHDGQHGGQRLDPIDGTDEWTAAPQLQQNGPPGQAHGERLHRGVLSPPVGSPALIVVAGVHRNTLSARCLRMMARTAAACFAGIRQRRVNALSNFDSACGQ
jgi:hypothetical protein